jgi:hypothetical protein
MKLGRLKIGFYSGEFGFNWAFTFTLSKRHSLVCGRGIEIGHPYIEGMKFYRIWSSYPKR